MIFLDCRMISNYLQVHHHQEDVLFGKGLPLHRLEQEGVIVPYSIIICLDLCVNIYFYAYVF